MKTIILSLLLIVVMLTQGCAIIPGDNLVLNVENQDGVPVSVVPINVAFHPNSPLFESTKTPDATGVLTVRCPKDVFFASIRPQTQGSQYYYTSFRHYARVQDKNGKWQSWNPTVKVIIKEHKNPIPMYATYSDNYHHITKGCWQGFDMSKNDWIKPYGKGEVIDFEVLYKFKGTSDKPIDLRALVFRFSDEYAGAYIFDADSWSEYISPYHANPNKAFQKELTFSLTRNEDGTFDNQTLPDNQGLIVRTRTRIDKDGKLIGAHYAKFYGPIAAKAYSLTDAKVPFQYYFNPTENDTNIEYSGENIFKTGRHGPRP